MASDLVTRFLEQAGELPYREVVGHNARKQTHGMLSKILTEETAKLPTQLAGRIERYVAALGARFFDDAELWRTWTSRQAFGEIVGISRAEMGLSERLPDSASWEQAENQDLVFRLFQIATLHLAYAAATKRAVRNRMGIKIGLFFR